MRMIEWMVSLAQSSIWITVLVVIGAYILKPLVMFIPVTALYIAAGVIFPTWVAFVITYGGIVLALTSGYYVGKFLGERKVNDYVAKNEKVSQFLDGCDGRFSAFCFIYRILPLPFDLFNLMCGATKVPFWKYLIVSLLGLSPAIVPYILVGTYITTPLTPEFLLPFGISLAFSLSMFILYKRGRYR